MEVRQIWWRKWDDIRLPKMVGQTLEIYYLVDTTTDCSREQNISYWRNENTVSSKT